MHKKEKANKEDEVILIGFPPEWRAGIEKILESKGKHSIYIDRNTRETSLESDDPVIKFAQETHDILIGASGNNDGDS